MIIETIEGKPHRKKKKKHCKNMNSALEMYMEICNSLVYVCLQMEKGLGQKNIYKEIKDKLLEKY